MNKEHKPEQEFHTVRFFRSVKEKIAEETKDMSFSDFKKYLSRRTVRLHSKITEPETVATTPRQ